MELWRDQSEALWKRVLFFFLSAYLHLGVFLGVEEAYITCLLHWVSFELTPTVFPFLAWNIDIGLCRRIVIIWSLVMVFGQALKDHFKVVKTLWFCSSYNSFRDQLTSARRS